ncbi:MAG: hypothetical protein LAN63_06580 [Acidobacteriia bacterium]|nr:hypothetical protein [Terriglobia bacterium]
MASANVKELARVAAALLVEVKKQEQANRATVAEIKQQAEALGAATSKLAASHSGSNFGYHGALYYRDFEVPSIRSMFNVEWGGIHGLPAGWAKREPDEVKARIEAETGLAFRNVEEAVKAPLESAKRLLREILIQLAPLHQLPDGNREKQLLEGLEQFDWKDSAHNEYCAHALKSFPNMTRDSGAVSQGMMLPSHTYYEAVSTQIRRSCEAIERFWDSTDRLLRQLQLASTSRLVVHDDEKGKPGNLVARYERLKAGALLLAALVLSIVLAVAAEYLLTKWRWQWLLSHPNSYSIQWLTFAVLLLFLVGLFVRKFRNYCWGFGLIPLLVGVLQLLGGPAHTP